MADPAWITQQNVMQVGTAAFAVCCVCNGLQRALNFNPKWLGLVVSLLLSFFIIVMIDRSTDSAGWWLLAVLNGFVIYASAAGLNAVGASTQSAVTAKGDRAASTAPRRGFLAGWWASPPNAGDE